MRFSKGSDFFNLLRNFSVGFGSSTSGGGGDYKKFLFQGVEKYFENSSGTVYLLTKFSHRVKENFGKFLWGFVSIINRYFSPLCLLIISIFFFLLIGSDFTMSFGWA